MTAREYLFSKYPLVSSQWFDDNELTQEMIKMMDEYFTYRIKQFQNWVNDEEFGYIPDFYIDEYLKQRKP